MSDTILVTGGAGYIGSHMVKLLLQKGYEVVVVDDLSGGHRDAVVGGSFVQADIADAALVEQILTRQRVSAVIHFAGFIQVGESVRSPAKYYRNNVAGTLVLLDVMRRCGVGKFIFSSSAAVYGEPSQVPIPESHPGAPLNPYGQSKWMIEQILADYRQSYGLASISLRYFNAAGADPSGTLGERHQPETHLIPLVLKVATGQAASVSVFGTDYDTPDGTCIRDYVHVIDLCEAHMLALEALGTRIARTAYNLGNGTGYSVNEVLATAQYVSGRSIRAIPSPRRSGDPARLVADSRLARSDLGWRPQYESLETIIAHAWAWEEKQGSRTQATPVAEA